MQQKIITPFMKVVITCCTVFLFFSFLIPQKVQYKPYSPSPFSQSQSSNFKISLRIQEDVVDSSSVNLMLVCNGTANEEIMYLFYDNQSLIDFGVIQEGYFKFNLSQKVHENGIHYLSISFFNSSSFTYIETTLIYEIDSFSSKTDLETNIYWIIGAFGVGSVISIATISGYRYVLRKKSFFTLSDTSSKSKFSIFGQPNSYYYNFAHLKAIPSQSRYQFMLNCASIIEIRLFSVSTMKLLYQTTMKPEIIKGLKESTIQEIMNNLTKRSSNDESLFQLQVEYLKNSTYSNVLSFLPIRDEKHFMLVILNISETCIEFNQTLGYALNELKHNPNIPTVINDYLNIEIATPLYFQDFSQKKQGFIAEIQKYFHDLGVETDPFSNNALQFFRNEINQDLDALNLFDFVSLLDILKRLTDELPTNTKSLSDDDIFYSLSGSDPQKD